MTSEALNSALTEVNEDLSLAEGRVQRLHACKFPLLDSTRAVKARALKVLKWHG